MLSRWPASVAACQTSLRRRRLLLFCRLSVDRRGRAGGAMVPRDQSEIDGLLRFRVGCAELAEAAHAEDDADGDNAGEHYGRVDEHHHLPRL
uniref:Uncharacterized protein n=1 Tax=Steinernema glaseri TaxID=37863 RepID=A0A1I7ZS13_9BILA